MRLGVRLLRLQTLGTMRGTAMSYERPVVQIRDVADGFLDLFIPQRTDAPACVDWRATRLKEFIDTHPSALHTKLDDVCKQLGVNMSGRQARRLFKTSIRMGFREYTKNRRLALAAGQLQATNIPVKAIAIDAGYHSSRHFARSFKELFRLRPLEFRKIWAQRNLAA
jgi:methylphosphotriester-DNA--protein-cysteine methyltransferase